MSTAALSAMAVVETMGKGISSALAPQQPARASVMRILYVLMFSSFNPL
jgi:hypothetical protein